MKTRKGREQGDLFGILGHAAKVATKPTGLDRLKVVDFELFRKVLEGRLNYGDQTKGGRIPWDAVLMFKVLVLQKFYGLSDEDTEFQIMDRFSFMRFLKLQPGDGAPDSTTIWSYKERLGEAGIRECFELFDARLKSEGLVGKEGRIIDASFVEAPRQRNDRDDNAQIKRGERPAHFDENPHVGSHKDTDARWTKKNEQVFYGYKNHVKMDASSKFIEDYAVTDASVHDSQVVKTLVTEADRGRGLWVDSAYKGEPIAAYLKGLAVLRFLCAKGKTEAERKIMRTYSCVRCRVEHGFGRMTQMGADQFHRIGKARADFETGLCNLTYNLDRYAMFHSQA